MDAKLCQNSSFQMSIVHILTLKTVWLNESDKDILKKVCAVTADQISFGATG